jgi:hypothetical protein
MSGRTRHACSVLAAMALVGALAGCSGGSDDATAPDESSATTSGGPTDQPTGEPTSTSSSSEFTQGPTQNPNGSRGSRAKASRIPAGELPGLNDTWTWRVESQGPGPGESAPSLCTLSSLESVGAKSSYRTDYDSAVSKSAHATVITAVFPDLQTATLAKTVLRSWQAQCARRLKHQFSYENVTVGPIGKVQTDVGVGEEWLSSFGPVAGHADEAWFQGEGFVADGDTLTYVVIASIGQDYNYEPGQQPVELALAVAGAKLEQTG